MFYLDLVSTCTISTLSLFLLKIDDALCIKTVVLCIWFLLNITLAFHYENNYPVS
jgi:hypothetical protein